MSTLPVHMPSEAAEVAQIPLTITEVGTDHRDLIRDLNVAIFDDEHVINTFDRHDLLMLVAWSADTAVGFKIGYRHDESTFYSAKGGVHPAYRRQGVARALLYAMLAVVRERGYARFLYDTFPNKHPGMTVMGLEEGFEVVRAGYNARYDDYRLRFEHMLDGEASAPSS